MTRHGRAGVVALALVMLGGCGGGRNAAPEAGSNQRSAVVLDAIDATTAARTARVEMVIDGRESGVAFELTAGGIVDLKTRNSQLTVVAHRGSASLSNEVRVVDGVDYVGENGKWRRMPGSVSASTDAGNSAIDALAELRGVTDDLHATGHGISHGDRTTQYSGTLDLERAANVPGTTSEARARFTTARRELGSDTWPYTAEIDAHGRLRKVAVRFNTATANFSLNLELYDFGVPLA